MASRQFSWRKFSLIAQKPENSQKFSPLIVSCYVVYVYGLCVFLCACTSIHFTHAGLISTINVLSNISSNTLALATSFNTLQTTLDTIRTQISNLLLNCSNNVMNEEICNMIRSSGEINTEANYSAVSSCNVFSLL